MENQTLAVFVEGVENYFKTRSDANAKVGTPFLVDNINDYISQYTGFISISGVNEGTIMFTSDEPILQHLLKGYGSIDKTEENYLDLVGEIANTVSGNARKTLGNGFILSVPIILKGEQEAVKTTKTFEIYVVPIIWKGHKASIILNLK